MSDLVERLRGYASDDHERGCQGRYYDCSCGYDDKRDPLMNQAAARIEQLEAALRDLLRLVEEDPEEDDPSPYLFDQVCDRARAALEERT